MMQFLISLAQRNQGWRIAVGILTVFFYALQHPLTNPYYRAVAQDVGGQIEALLTTELSSLVAYLLLLFIPEIRRGAYRVIRNRNSAGIVVISSLIGIGSLYSYIIAQASLSSVELSLILNVSPAASVIAAAIFSGKRVGFAYVAFATSLSGFIVMLSICNERETLSWNFNAVAYIAAFATPALFYTGFQVIAEKFKGEPESIVGGVAVASILGSSFMATIAGIQLVIRAEPMLTFSLPPTMTVLLVVGTILPAVCGRILYHVTVEVAQRSQDEISISFYLVPGFTVVISYLIAVLFPDISLMPKPYHLIGILVVLIAVIAYSRIKIGGDSV